MSVLLFHCRVSESCRWWSGFRGRRLTPTLHPPTLQMHADDHHMLRSGIWHQTQGKWVRCPPIVCLQEKHLRQLEGHRYRGLLVGIRVPHQGPVVLEIPRCCNRPQFIGSSSEFLLTGNHGPGRSFASSSIVALSAPDCLILYPKHVDSAKSPPTPETLNRTLKP